jgi:hypothetical protein
VRPIYTSQIALNCLTLSASWQRRGSWIRICIETSMSCTILTLFLLSDLISTILFLSKFSKTLLVYLDCVIRSSWIVRLNVIPHKAIMKFSYVITCSILYGLRYDVRRVFVPVIFLNFWCCILWSVICFWNAVVILRGKKYHQKHLPSHSIQSSLLLGPPILFSWLQGTENQFRFTAESDH